MVYIFYFKYKYDDPNTEPAIMLYAFTDDKKMAELFYDTRDHDNIILKTHKWNKELYDKLRREYPSRKICIGKFYTSSQDIYGKREHISFPCTYEEEIRVAKMMDDYYEEVQKYIFYPFIFEKRYIDALDKLNFICSYILYSQNSNVFDIDKYNHNHYFDELNLFLCKYQNIISR